jgi:zinc protease
MKPHFKAFTACFPLLAASLAAPQAPLLAKAPAAQTASTAAEPVWAFEKSDLPVDPAFKFGRLPNGMRYVIRHNATPKGQGQVRLYVNAGSLDEHDDEQGYAHFIEHMAFNGSTHVPEGEMVKLLERKGLAFGADTNAQTGFEQTVYMLDLPRNDADLLNTALMLMRETASELTFAQGAVDRERGVVLSEKRVRDTFAFRDFVDGFKFLYPEAKFAHRLPIGTTEDLDAANSKNLKALWDRVYTPGNVTLIVVGDFDPAQVEAEIKQHFADWGSEPTPPASDTNAGPVDFSRKGLTEVYTDPSLSENVTASVNGPWLDEPDTIASRKTKLLRRIGYAIVNRRLERIAHGDKPPFRRATFGTGEMFKTVRTTQLSVDTGDGEWNEGLAAAVAEYRRAMKFGFTKAEVAEQVANIRTALQNNAAAADTLGNSVYTSEAIALLSDEQVPTTPQSALARFNAMESGITPEAVLAALNTEALPLNDPLLRFEGRTAPNGGEKALRDAWNEDVAAPIAQISAKKLGGFGYTDFGTPGKVVEDKVDPRLGIRTLRFANGLRLNLKHTDIQHDRISYELNIDGGQMLDTKSNPIATNMVSLLPLGGLGKHSYDDLQTILAGHTVGFSIFPDTETFVMGGTTTPRDLELQLDLLTAAISDPGYRPQGEEQYRRSVENFFASKDATPERVLQIQGDAIISDDDPRFTLQPKADYLAQTFAQLKDNIGGRLSHGALELALVGDIDENQAISLVAKTLGALPQRELEDRPYTDNRNRSFTADRGIHTLYHNGKADQAVVDFDWPTRDDSDFTQDRELEMLERVVEIEVMDTLREKLGQTYSPQVDAQQSRYYPGWGTFEIEASVDTSQVNAVRKAIIETIDKLRSAPVDDDVMARARNPLLEAYDNALKTNGGWMNLVDRAQSESDRIDRFLKGKAIVQSLTGTEVQAMAVKYLDPARRLEIDVLPKNKAKQ